MSPFFSLVQAIKVSPKSPEGVSELPLSVADDLISKEHARSFLSTTIYLLTPLLVEDVK